MPKEIKHTNIDAASQPGLSPDQVLCAWLDRVDGAIKGQEIGGETLEDRYQRIKRNRNFYRGKHWDRQPPQGRYQAERPRGCREREPAAAGV